MVRIFFLNLAYLTTAFPWKGHNARGVLRLSLCSIPVVPLCLYICWLDLPLVSTALVRGHLGTGFYFKHEHSFLWDNFSLIFLFVIHSSSSQAIWGLFIKVYDMSRCPSKYTLSSLSRLIESLRQDQQEGGPRLRACWRRQHCVSAITHTYTHTHTALFGSRTFVLGSHANLLFAHVQHVYLSGVLDSGKYTDKSLRERKKECGVHSEGVFVYLCVFLVCASEKAAMCVCVMEGEGVSGDLLSCFPAKCMTHLY